MITRNISQNWDRLMRLGSKLNYGEARIVFQNGEPIRVEQAVKIINLNSEEEYNKGLETIIL